jgi:5-methylcytosine-specific restriction endonuclease McrA
MLCGHCKIEFEPSRKRQLYCSRKCQWKACRKRNHRWGDQKRKRRQRGSPYKIMRNIVLSFFDNKCSLCGSNKKLHIHHVVPVGLGGKNEYKNIIILYSSCHTKIHMENMNI